MEITMCYRYNPGETVFHITTVFPIYDEPHLKCKSYPVKSKIREVALVLGKNKRTETMYKLESSDKWISEEQLFLDFISADNYLRHIEGTVRHGMKKISV